MPLFFLLLLLVGCVSVLKTIRTILFSKVMFALSIAIVSLVGLVLSRVVLVEYVQLLVLPNAPSPETEIYNYTGNYYMNTTFAELMLHEHNTLRRSHGAQPLRWDTQLFEFASWFASVYNCSGILEHSGYKYGENLAFGYQPLAAIQAWYDEGETYIYGSESIYNHFTALVWNSTDSLGCAYKQCDNGLYTVCSYNPPGNVIGHSTQNVFPPVSSKMVT